MSSGTHTLLPPHILPSSACLLISLGSGRKLPPFLPKCRLSISTLFPPVPPILLCMLFSLIASLTGLQREKRRGRGIKQSPQLDSPHKRTSELYIPSSSVVAVFIFQLQTPLFPSWKHTVHNKGRENHLALKNRKPRQAFKVYLHWEEGVSLLFLP